MTNLLVLFLYMAALVYVGLHHEPWFDEAQAWQIGRCASYSDILFKIPHYEGHPALWHLILSVPAKLGLDYELSLRVIGLVFSSLATALILFKSRLPFFIRYLLPFSYFPFYQFGVIVRPYCIMYLAFVLIALTFRERNEKPICFILSLGFLCLTSAYGILFAGGITIAWILEDLLASVSQKNSLDVFVKGYIKKKQFLPLIGLLLLAILLLLQILPAKDTYGTNIEHVNPIWINYLYTFLAMPADATVSDIMSTNSSIMIEEFLVPSLIMGCFIGMLIHLLWSLFLGYRKHLYYIIPFIMFAGFGGTVYLYNYHVGILFLFYIFLLWITWEDEERLYLGKRIFALIQEKLTEEDKKAIHNLPVVIVSFCLLVPTVWTLLSSRLEIGNEYIYAHDMAQFIKDNGLEDCSFLAQWYEGVDEDFQRPYELMNVNKFINCGCLLPYFEKNILWNINDGKDGYNFMPNKVASTEDNIDQVRRWREMGYPDLLILEPDINLIYDGEISIVRDYTCVYAINPAAVSIWKGMYDSAAGALYLRNDLLEKYGLQEVAMEDYEVKMW